MAGTGTAHLRDSSDVLLRVDDLTVQFRTSAGTVHAVSGISFDVLDRETVGLVGESGCGKSTTGRALLQLPPPTSGSVQFEGVELTSLSREEMRRMRKRMQIIFQDPVSSLNPRHRVRQLIGEGLDIWPDIAGNERDARVREMMDLVGLTPSASDRRPFQFSGGQCQRICIARSLVLEPKMLVCDEPVSALDVSVQAQILNLLEEMKARYGLAMLFIAHDLAVVKNVSDRVIVMYLGKICEVAPPDPLYQQPAHPYTRVLLESIPEPDPTLVVTPDTSSVELPSPLDPPSGCRFRTRCPKAQDRCAAEEPILRRVNDGHFVACHFPNAPVADAQEVAV